MAAALVAAIAVAGLAAPAAEAHGKHRHFHKFFHKPHFYTGYYYKPVCGKWFWSYRRDRWVCAWWY
jgi:hypothetical protein